MGLRNNKKIRHLALRPATRLAGLIARGFIPLRRKTALLLCNCTRSLIMDARKAPLDAAPRAAPCAEEGRGGRTTHCPCASIPHGRARGPTGVPVHAGAKGPRAPPRALGRQLRTDGPRSPASAGSSPPLRGPRVEGHGRGRGLRVRPTRWRRTTPDPAGARSARRRERAGAGDARRARGRTGQAPTSFGGWSRPWTVRNNAAAARPSAASANRAPPPAGPPTRPGSHTRTGPRAGPGPSGRPGRRRAAGSGQGARGARPVRRRRAGRGPGRAGGRAASGISPEAITWLST